MRVVIADDHPAIRRGLRRVLAAAPDIAVVGEARTGDDALALVRRVECEVAVLDYVMPGLSGLDLLRTIKCERPACRVIVLSMHAEELYAASVLKAGASAYLSKESIAEKLTDTIRRITNGDASVGPAQDAIAPSEPAAPAQTPLHESLSDREFRVMWMLATGNQVDQVAQAMRLNLRTISTCRTRILTKLGLADDAQIASYAVRNRLVD